MPLSTVGYPTLMGAQLSKIIMPHYAAALQGRKDILEDIAQCFTTALVTIRLRRELEWTSDPAQLLEPVGDALRAWRSSTPGEGSWLGCSGCCLT